MSETWRSKTLERAVEETVKVYGIAFILVVIVLFCLPLWIKWGFLYVCGIMFLVSVVGPFVRDWMPRKRILPHGKAVFITGCDSGFGYFLARRLDQLGLEVFAGCLLPDGIGAATLKESSSLNLHIVPIDVTSEISIGKAVECVTGKLNDKKLWALVNNAGINDGGELIWTNNDIIKKVSDVNTFGVVMTTKAFLPLLVKHKGRVVTIASAAGRYTYGGLVPYCMSKQAAVSFCDGLRQEIYRFDVKVVTIEPWFYKTPITSEEATSLCLSKSWESSPEEIKQLFPKDYLNNKTEFYLKILHTFMNDKPQEVVGCLEEAIMAETPKYSYNPGTLASRFSFWVYSRLPKPVTDLILTGKLLKYL